MIFLDIFKSYRGDEIWTLNVLFWNPKKKKVSMREEAEDRGIQFEDELTQPS